MADTPIINTEQLAILRHALGYSGATPPTEPFRNHYCTRDGDERLEAMVAEGWMEHGRTLNDGQDRYYFVTPAGRAAAEGEVPNG